MDTRKLILYPKYFDMAESLSDEEFGRVVRAIGSFFTDGDEDRVKDFSKHEKILYKTMKIEIKANLDKYEKKVEQCREAARSGAEKRRNAERMLANAGNNNNNNINNNININKNMNNNKNNNSNNCAFFPSLELDPQEEARLREKLAQIHQSAME